MVARLVLCNQPFSLYDTSLVAYKVLCYTRIGAAWVANILQNIFHQRELILKLACVSNFACILSLVGAQVWPQARDYFD